MPTRLGPGKRRLTRSQWQTEKAEAARLAQRREDILGAEKVIADRLTRAHRLEIEVAAKAAAIEAWGNGKLIGPDPTGATGEERLAFQDPAEARDSGLVAGLAPAWSWIHTWTGRANVFVEHRVEQLASKRTLEAVSEIKLAIVTAAKAWATGLLWRRGKGLTPSGEPTLVVDRRWPDEGQILMKRLDGNRHIVADLLDQLPDRELIKRVSDLTTELGPYLENAEKSKASTFRSLTSRAELLKAQGRDRSWVRKHPKL